MMRLSFAVLAATAAVAAFTTFGDTVATASPYRWCAQYPERIGGGRNCGFVTFRQCQATVSGTGGFCEPNPFYNGGRHRHRRDYRYYRD